MTKLATGFCVFVFVGLTLSSIIDIFEATNGHEPRVAIQCGKVPFKIDLKTGAWVEDSTGIAHCDEDKNDVKRYCQKAYPKLNITNIVEANKRVKFNNWCKPGHGAQCDTVKKVVPYRCLVNEYEADALMVPNGCKFDHLHDQSMCLTHDDWKKKAAKECKRKYTMKLRDYGILLSCKTDFFTGVEFVCCPPKVKKGHKKTHKKIVHVERKVDREAFIKAIKSFRRYLPEETAGCDRTTYVTKQTEMEDRHRNKIAAVVDEWDGAEKRYNKLRVKDQAAADEKMQRTLEVFRTTLKALENESKSEKGRLRAEHADCINTQISKNKRDAMVAYLVAIEELPVNAEQILKAVRKFIQVCEHDRVHSLRHFEHVRNRNAKKAETLRVELLQHLKDLNKVVNESMALLNYLPEIAEKFGMTGSIGGVILKPKLEVPVEEHTHGRISQIQDSNIFKEIAENYEDGEDKQEPTEDAPTETRKTSLPRIPTDDIPVEPKPESETSTKPTDKEVKNLGAVEKNFAKVENNFAKVVERFEDLEEVEHDDDEDEDEDDKLDEKKKHKNHKHKHDHHGSKSPFAFNAIMGLSCGVLVIMLFVVIAMVMRRRRLTRTRVVLAENNDDREHLVQMQRNGFENPTYKFFYY